jgi:L-threonylcarbamoyladenylate synthase
MISVEQIEALIGKVEIATAAPEGSHPAPGMHPRHYSPHTPLVLALPGDGHGAYLWLTHPAASARSVQMPADPAHYAAALYEILHRLDEEGFDWIAVEPPPDEPAWAGIRDRLQRAAS